MTNPVWKVRFWSIFGGQAISLMGSSVTQFILIWWVAETTQSVSALAGAGVAVLLPQALLAPLGGTFADRYSRRALMIAADSISALSMLVLILLFLSKRTELWHVYTMVCIRSAMSAFQTPAASASTAMLVPTNFIPRVAGLYQTISCIILVTAAPVGAIAASTFPIGLVLAIDPITALLGIMPLLAFRVPQPPPPRQQTTKLWSEFMAGASLVWSERGLRQLYGMLGVLTLVMMPASMLLPMLVQQHFLGGRQQLAMLEALSGVGWVCGGLLVAAFAPRRQIRWTLWGLATSCFSVSLVAMTPRDHSWLAGLWWAVCSAAYVIGAGPLNAMLQRSIPNHMQGRAFSLLGSVMGISAPLALAVIAPLGELIGVRSLFVLLGLLGGCVVLVGFLSADLLRLDTSVINDVTTSNIGRGQT